jgi:hypothetical protein
VALLALLLCASPTLAQQHPGDPGYEPSRLRYVFPIVFVASLAALGLVIVAATLTRHDDGARLRSATAKVDEALRGLAGGAPSGTAAYNIRSGREWRPGRGALAAARLDLGPLPTARR